MYNNLHQTKLILYRMERNFGIPVLFRIPTENSYDVTTGAVTREYTDILVRKTVVLPTRTLREFSYYLSYIAANKNFTYGAFYDKSTKHFIVRSKHLKGNIPNTSWRVELDRRLYSIVEFTETEDGEGYLLICTALDELLPVEEEQPDDPEEP